MLPCGPRELPRLRRLRGFHLNLSDCSCVHAASRAHAWATRSSHVTGARADATAFDPFDGTVIATLLDDTTASAGSFLSGNYDAAAFGDFPVIPGQAAGSVDFNFGIALRFDVSAGDTAAFTSSMAVAVPGPGALALMGLVGMHRRRRRD